MDIVIKSFNRPYYLDRCIQSIYLNSQKRDFSIKILDDGTPQKYLDKLQEKFPEIQIYKSEWYEHKSSFCTVGKKPEIMTIPIDFWVNGTKSVSEYFLLLEDDIWINQKVDFEKMMEEAKSDNVSFLKLFWLGNPKLIQTKSTTKKKEYTLYKPKLYTKYPLLFYIVFYKFDCFKIRKTLRSLKIHTDEKYLSYYSIYSVAGMIFKRDYFLSLWKNHKNTVDENLQLYNSLKHYFKNETVYAHSNSEIVTQGILSAATNQFKNFEGINTDMFLFNKIVNEAWYNNEFDVMKNYPKDLDMDTIEAIIKKENNINLKANQWKEWVLHCKNQYRNFGCIVE